MFRAVMTLAYEDDAIQRNPAEVAAKHLPKPSTHRNAEGHVVPTFSAKPPNRKRGGYTHGERGSVKADGAAHGSLDWSEPIEPRAFCRNVYLPALVGVGLPKSRLHDLPHAFARTYLANGGDIHRLSEQMGPGSYRITYDVYAEWIPSEDDAPSPLDQRPNESQPWGS